MSSMPSLFAHAPELRNRYDSLLLLSLRGHVVIHRLPVHVERPRHAVFAHPRPQRVGHPPGRFLGGKRRQAGAGSVIHHVDKTTARPAILQPRLEAAVHLHQFPEVPAPLPPLPVWLAFSLSGPQPLGQHPPAQRLGVYGDAVILLQMLRRQGGTETLARCSAVMLPHQSHNTLPPLRRRRPIRCLAGAGVDQTRRSRLPVAHINPLQLPIAHPQHLRRFHLRQLFFFDPLEHPGSAYLFLAHPCPSQPDLLAQFGGHFYRATKGTLSWRHNTRMAHRRRGEHRGYGRRGRGGAQLSSPRASGTSASPRTRTTRCPQ